VTEEKSKVENKRKPGKPKGLPKSGGRKKGTPNKNSTSLRDAMDRAGFNLAEEFIALYQQETDLEKKRNTLYFLFRYVYPALKEVEQTPESGDKTSATDVPTDSLLSIVKP
jgi:hypothetical protein